MMYRGFKQECPNGAVNEDTFKEIYEKFFPHGSKRIKQTGLWMFLRQKNEICLFLFSYASSCTLYH